MKYYLSQIAKITNGFLMSKQESEITTLLFDSRLVFANQKSLFFAVKGAFNDGHHYISDLYLKGVRNFCVNDYFTHFNEYPEANFLVVKNTVEALQKIAEYHRQQFKIPVFGITGSNGKTIVKEWLASILSKKQKIAYSPKSYNSQIGVPLSVWDLNENHQIGIFEAGISQIAEMTKLQRIIKPTIGIFTNIGDAHQENFDSIEQKIFEKLELFKDSEVIIYQEDSAIISNAVQLKFPDKKTFTWSFKKDSDLKVSKIGKENNTTTIDLIYHSKYYTIQFNFIDRASIENILTVLSALLYFYKNSVPSDYNFQELSPVEMRLDQIQGINKCTIINDSYNSDLTSLRIAIELLSSQKQHTKKTVILSDILQHGQNKNELYNELALIIKNAKIDRFIGVGNNMFKFSYLFNSENSHFFNTTNDFLAFINKMSFFDEAILIKGSRTFNFERVTEALQQKNHKTVLEINIPALDNNLRYFRNLLEPNTKLMIMVKAFSYGSGSFEIANFLQRKNVDYLAVAITDEGYELRKGGINLPILILNPDSANFNSFIDYNLEPEIYNFRILHEFYKEIENKILTKFPIHIKINTGMNRLGFNLEEIDYLLEELKKMPKIYVKSVFSHLVGSDAEKFDYFTEQQIGIYSKAVNKLKSGLDYDFIRHILNSAGIERFPQYQFDMVRLGIGLYGISSLPNSQLKNISTLKTKIVHLNNVNSGETVGYSRVGKVEKNSLIATLPIGYADGLNRHLSNGVGKVLINGKLAPIIGNICMDLTMIDVTGIEVHEGDDVIIFGDNLPITQLSEQLGTIPYEILTSVSQRVKRIYMWE